MYIVTVNRMCYDTQTLLSILKESLKYRVQRRTDSQLYRWYFNFPYMQEYQAFWAFLQTQRPMELP